MGPRPYFWNRFALVTLAEKIQRAARNTAGPRLHNEEHGTRDEASTDGTGWGRRAEDAHAIGAPRDD